MFFAELSTKNRVGWDGGWLHQVGIFPTAEPNTQHVVPNTQNFEAKHPKSRSNFSNTLGHAPSSGELSGSTAEPPFASVRAISPKGGAGPAQSRTPQVPPPTRGGRAGGITALCGAKCGVRAQWGQNPVAESMGD